MPLREFDTGFWESVRKLPAHAKLLVAWSFTNTTCQPSGLYEVLPETIAFDTGIPEKELGPLFEQIKSSVVWYPDRNIIWVKNFIKRQAKSSTFLKAVAKSLANMNCEDIIQELLKYNQERYGITIPYEFYRQKFARLSKVSSSLLQDSSSAKEAYAVENILDPNLAAIAKCYENNIGIITQMIFERLKDIADNYPEGWFQKAVEEALVSGKRNLKYVEAILERWRKEDFNPLSLKRKPTTTKFRVEE